MQAIKVLRQRAADKRDRAIRSARDEFRKATRLLDELQSQLGAEQEPAKRKSAVRPMIDIIQSVIPRDKPFSLADLVNAIEQAEPGRKLHIPSIRTIMPDLVKLGVIRKVRRAAKGHVYWAHLDCKVADSPIAAMNILDATETVLSGRGPSTAAEIVVTLKEKGYRVDADPRALLTTLRYAFKRCKGRFVRDGNRWSCAGVSARA